MFGNETTKNLFKNIYSYSCCYLFYDYYATCLFNGILLVFVFADSQKLNVPK